MLKDQSQSLDLFTSQMSKCPPPKRLPFLLCVLGEEFCFLDRVVRGGLNVSVSYIYRLIDVDA